MSYLWKVEARSEGERGAVSGVASFGGLNTLVCTMEGVQTLTILYFLSRLQGWVQVLLYLH